MRKCSTTFQGSGSVPCPATLRRDPKESSSPSAATAASTRAAGVRRSAHSAAANAQIRGIPK